MSDKPFPDLDLSAISFALPSKESLKASSIAWYRRAGATFLDNYPPALAALAPETTLIEWPKSDTEEFFSEDQMDLPVAFHPLSDAIDKACSWNWKFLRLNSRSPKDVMQRGEFVCCGRQALLHIRESERCLDDLVMFSHSPYPAYVALREPLHLTKGLEFRIFVRDGELIGVAQYEEAPIAEEHRSAIERKIRDFYQTSLKHALHLKDVVVDVCLAGTREWRFLEINPYGLSDPCAGMSYDHIEENAGAFHWYPCQPEAMFSPETSARTHGR